MTEQHVDANGKRWERVLVHNGAIGLTTLGILPPRDEMTDEDRLVLERPLPEEEQFVSLSTVEGLHAISPLKVNPTLSEMYLLKNGRPLPVRTPSDLVGQVVSLRIAEELHADSPLKNQPTLSDMFTRWNGLPIPAVWLPTEEP